VLEKISFRSVLSYFLHLFLAGMLRKYERHEVGGVRVLDVSGPCGDGWG
jgi:hypothetical protein